jgi:hypothetical protein
MKTVGTPSATFSSVSTVTVVSPAEDPHIDATTEESLERTMKRAAESLPSTERGKFGEAVQLLHGDYMAKHPTDSAEESHVRQATLAGLRTQLHGKTAREVISEAETLVRRLIDAEAQRKQAATSRVLPPATAVLGDTLACDALISSRIKPVQPADADLLQVSDDSFMKPEAERKRLRAERRLEGSSSLGTDKLAIEVRGRELHFVTSASVETGAAFGPPFRIIKNDDSALAAVDLQEGLMGFTLSSFLLNKRNGLAVWTKSRPSFLIHAEPDTQAHYLRCR